jgi:hypothetical protein
MGFISALRVELRILLAMPLDDRETGVEVPLSRW